MSWEPGPPARHTSAWAAWRPQNLDDGAMKKILVGAAAFGCRRGPSGADETELAHRERTALVARTGAWRAQRGNRRLPVRLVDLKSVEVFVQEHHQDCFEFLLDANRSPQQNTPQPNIPP